MAETHEQDAMQRPGVRNHPIYLDNFATTQLAPEAAAAMLEAWAVPTNSGSPHSLGARAAGIVDTAKSRIADLIGAAPTEVFTTSGATEANNIALLGVAQAGMAAHCGRRSIVISAIEHKSVLEPAKHLQCLGFRVVIVPADARGVVDMSALVEAIDQDTLLVSVMGANNETGVIQPISEIGGIARAAGAYMHSDCAQLAGKVPIDVFDLNLDYLSLSGHKIYGPMGIGALYVSSSALRPEPLIFGGGQQGGMRSGTEPVPLIAGFGAAADLAHSRMVDDSCHASRLREIFLSELRRLDASIDLVTDALCVPGSLCLRAKGCEADELVVYMQRDLSISTGSACNSGQVLPSHVLTSMGFDDVTAREIFRVYFGRYNSEFEAAHTALILAKGMRQLGSRTGQSRQ